MNDPYARAAAAAADLASATGRPGHDVAVVLGSGWTPAADALGDADSVVAMDRLAGFATPTVAGHSGSVRSLDVEGRRAVVFAGRLHLYEGHDAATVVHSVRTAAAAGCGQVILTNAAGSLDRAFGVGQPVLISDHLNLTGHNPLAGDPPPHGRASRFVDMSSAYSPRLRDIARDVDPHLPEGVYAGLLGPSYETPAEIRMLRTLGADLVGMSTVLEAIAAAHLGLEVLGIALVTNLAAGMGPGLDHQEVVEAGRNSATRLATLLRAILARL